MRLHDMLEFHARVRPDAVALRDGTRSQTYAELDDAAERFASVLAAAGIPREGRVAILAKNCLEYYAVYLGAAKAGAVVVPLNTRLAPPEWAYLLADSEASLVVAQGDFVAALDAIRHEVPSVHDFVALDASPPDSWTAWADRLAGAPARPPLEPPVGPADAVVQMYTSGTTGRPKGAVLTHGALTSSMVQSAMVNPEGLTGCGHIVAPLAHIGAALTSMLSLLFGGSLYVQADFDMPEVVRILSKEGINRTMLVPAMIQALLVFVPDVAEREYPDLQLIGYGASPISAEVLRRAMEVFGCEFTQGYGCTESSGGLTVLTAADHRRALAEKPELLTSAGRAAFGTEVRVVDEHDRDVAPGEIGEIIARGPQLMREYWKQPDATAATLRGGWLHTGDAGTFDEEGYLYIKDRIKDMIVSGGENVYPAEVEQVLFEHPAVADAAVIGVPDERWGEAVKACVVLRPDTQVTEDELIEFCRTRIAGFKCPKSVDFLSELPRNAAMKVLKTELRRPYWEGRERQVS